MRSHICNTFCSALYFFTSGNNDPALPRPAFDILICPDLYLCSLACSTATSCCHLHPCVRCVWSLLHLQHFLFASAPHIALLPYSSSLVNLLAHQLLHSFILTSPLHLSVLRDPTPVRGCLQKLQLFFSVGLRTKGHIFFCCVSLILLALSICR